MAQRLNSFDFSLVTIRYLLGMSDSIFPSVLVGPLQQVMHLLPESRHRKLANIADNLKHQFLDLLGTNGVFLYPTFPTTAHRHYQIYHKLVDTGYMMVFNTIGLPVTNCMVRLDRHKLPIGIQVCSAICCEIKMVLLDSILTSIPVSCNRSSRIRDKTI